MTRYGSFHGHVGANQGKSWTERVALPLLPLSVRSPDELLLYPVIKRCRVIVASTDLTLLSQMTFHDATIGVVYDRTLLWLGYDVVVS